MIKHIALTATAIAAIGLTALIFTLPTPEAPFLTSEGIQSEQAQTHITNVRVIDGENLSSPQTIQMENGVIIAIKAGLEVPSNAVTIDGSDLIALPGLIDAHTHSYASSLQDALRFGVTSNLDMFSDIAILPRTRESREFMDKTNDADLFSAGMMATAPGGHGTQYGISIEPITQAEMAGDWVKKRKAEGSDYIKMVYIPGQARIPSLSRDTAKALITAAHEEGLLALAHVSTERAAQDLIEDGIDGLVHIFADKEASPDIIELAKKNDVFIIPTLSVIASADGKSAKLMDSLSKDILARLSPMQKQTLSTSFPGNAPGFSYDIALKNVKLFHDSGVIILAGSDAPNPGTAHGLSLHLELQHLVAAGLTPAEALHAAAAGPANIFNLEYRGSVSEGNGADIVLVGGDPLRTISDTLNISHVIKNGYLVPVKPQRTNPGKAIDSAILSDFENGLTTSNGLEWTPSDDRIANGTSEASLRLDNGVGLTVRGEVKPGFPYPWAGASIGVKQGATGLDVSKYKSIEFLVKGTAGTYRLMSFNAGATGVPPTQEFTIGLDWEVVTLSLDDFTGFDNTGFTGFAFVAGPAFGAFEFQLDDVKLK